MSSNCIHITAKWWALVLLVLNHWVLLPVSEWVSELVGWLAGWLVACSPHLTSDPLHEVYPAKGHLLTARYCYRLSLLCTCMQLVQCWGGPLSLNHCHTTWLSGFVPTALKSTLFFFISHFIFMHVLTLLTNDVNKP